MYGSEGVMRESGAWHGYFDVNFARGVGLRHTLAVGIGSQNVISHSVASISTLFACC